MKAVAYLRCSTEDQATRGVSLEAQRAKVEAYAGLYDLQLVAVVEDAGVSARTLDRPGLQKALAMLARGEAQALIVLKLDRLTRSVRDLGELLEGPFA
jgi:site-specific DNA recombinase